MGTGTNQNEVDFWDSAWEETGLRAIRAAGEILRSLFGKITRIEYKGVINLVTEADHASEKAIIRLISERFPEHVILAEECGGADRAENLVCRWIVDPLDGTTNYAHGFPMFCISIALEVAGTLVMGIIYDPFREELFFARKGGGAFMNQVPISVSQVTALDRSLLATGFPYDLRESGDNNLDYFAAIIRQAQAIRRCGSAALDLAYVAAGRFDGFWELKLFPWDVAAGTLLVREAGGQVTDFQGKEDVIDKKEILATNRRIHPALLEAIQRVLRHVVPPPQE